MYNTIGTGSSLALYLVTSHYSSFPFFPKTRVFMLCWQNVSCAFILYPPYCSSLGHNCKSLYNPPQQACHSRSSLKKISVSQGCYNTLSQTRYFITIEICSLSSGGWKSKCQQGRASSCKGLREESFLDSCGISRLPAVLSTLWVWWWQLQNLLLPSHGYLPSTCVCVQIPSSHKNTNHCIRAPLHPVRPHLICIWKDHISKRSQIYRFSVNMNGGRRGHTLMNLVQVVGILLNSVTPLSIQGVCT